MKHHATPTDELLELLDLVGTDEFFRRFSRVRYDIEDGAPAEPWISAAQVLRDLGTMSQDFAFWMIDMLSHTATEALIDADPRLVGLSRQMEAIERAAGLGKDESFRVGSGPGAWEAANREWDARFDHLRVELLRRWGETDMVRLWTLDRDEYDLRAMRGRLEVSGEVP